MKLFVALSAGLFLAAPLAAQTMNGGSMSSAADLSERGDVPESTGTGAANADGERRICRRIEIASGSRMATRRVCRTAEEWRQAQRGS